MGNDDAVAGDGEGSARPVTLDAFRIGATAVTNAAFAAFVRATPHVTDAERGWATSAFASSRAAGGRRHGVCQKDDRPAGAGSSRS